MPPLARPRGGRLCRGELPAGGAQEPRVEGAVERLEVLPPRDERLAQRPVDVLLPGEIDRIEAAQRIGDATGPDLEATFPQDTSEDDDVADDGVGLPVSHVRSRRDRRAPRRGSRAGPRGT